MTVIHGERDNGFLIYEMITIDNKTINAVFLCCVFFWIFKNALHFRSVDGVGVDRVSIKTKIPCESPMREGEG